MSKIKKLWQIIVCWFLTSCGYLYRGFKKGCFISYLILYIKQYFLYLEKFTKNLEENIELDDHQALNYDRLRSATQGLHSLVPGNERYFYSLLIYVTHPSEHYLKHSIEAALRLSAPYKEILVGIQKAKRERFSRLFQELLQNHSELKIVDVHDELSESEIINQLANISKGNYLFILPQGDWIRPDLLYRYEQTLNFFKDQQNIVLFCDEYLVTNQFIPIPKTRTLKPETPHFPYIFNDDLGRSLLIPKNLWESIGGLRKEANGVHAFDLPLRLDIAGAVFHKIPVYLYATLDENKRSNESNYAHLETIQKLIQSFKDYSQIKGLDWEWSKGYSNTTVRAIPNLLRIPNVHVVILYKDQAAMTLSAVQHILRQKGVHIKVTAIDNYSKDLSIAQNLKELGVEVIRVEEPFNYSRLNNIAVHQTKIGQDCEHILFLNNDVDLEPDALLEMCRWMVQTGIGLVGCRLNYPNGLLQHGGVVIKASRAAFIKSWHHAERMQKFSQLRRTNYLRISAAVTAACCLINRKIFMEVEGFDELWFPVAFSDTALAVKIRAKGLHCFYTPFAEGIHHESISRKKVNIEDYETLTWAHRKFVQKLWNDEKIHFNDLINTEY